VEAQVAPRCRAPQRGAVAGPVDEAAVHRMAETLLANTVIEEFRVHIEPA
jgi:hypothetical protein